MTREDVDAIHAYLQSLEPVSKKNRGNGLHFPFNIRMSMLGWRELFFESGTFEPDTRKSKHTSAPGVSAQMIRNWRVEHR
jgi:hypothetical protein